MIAVIADIHANLQALEAVLKDVAEVGATEIVVNGDLVNRGPNNAAVVERIFNLENVSAVTLGNHDDLMRKWVDRDPDIPAYWFEDAFWDGMAWPAEQLAETGQLGRLRGLPMTYLDDRPGRPSILFSHGSPRHYREGYASYLEDNVLADIIAHYPADILVGSHTHRPYEYRYGEHLVLNTGAVGTPFNGDPRAQYLLLREGANGWHHEFRAVPYDRTTALSAFETSGYLEAGGLSARIFYEELRLARPLYMGFWDWTEAQDLPKDWESWDAFKGHYAGRFQAAV